MKCWVCALEDKETNAMAVCQECGVALCNVHKLEGEAHRGDGGQNGCTHLGKADGPVPATAEQAALPPGVIPLGALPEGAGVLAAAPGS